MNIINLNKKRKAKEKLEKGKKAAANRLKFGRTKQQLEREEDERARSESYLNAHKLDNANTLSEKKNSAKDRPISVNVYPSLEDNETQISEE